MNKEVVQLIDVESNNVMAVSREGHEGLAGKEMKRLYSYRLSQRKILDIEYKPSWAERVYDLWILINSNGWFQAQATNKSNQVSEDARAQVSIKLDYIPKSIAY